MGEIKELIVVTGLTNPPNTVTCINTTIKKYIDNGWVPLGEPKIGNPRFQPMSGLTANGSIQAPVAVTMVKYETQEEFDTPTAVFAFRHGNIDFAGLDDVDFANMDVTIQHVHHGRVREYVSSGLDIAKVRNRHIESKDDLKPKVTVCTKEIPDDLRAQAEENRRHAEEANAAQKEKKDG